MPEPEIFAHAIGTTAAVSLPERGLEAELAAARYLRIALAGSPSRVGVFEVDKIPRVGAEGTDIYLQPGQLGLVYDEHVRVTASPVTRWAYRRSELNTPNGYLILGTFASALVVAGIDGSLAIGNLGTTLFEFDTATLGLFSMVSLFCKGLSAALAFLLAWGFKK